MEKTSIILTVQSAGSRNWHLGINFSDLKTYFKVRKTKVKLIINEFEFQTNTTCGLPLKKGFDLYSKDIQILSLQVLLA